MRILYAGDSPTVGTGFGTVAKNLLNRFIAMGHEVVVLGINHYGEPYNQKEFPYMIYPCDKGGHEQVFGFRKFWAIYESMKPDIVFFLNDPWLITNYMEYKPEKLAPHTKFIAYYPTDSSPMKSDWLKVLNAMDIQVCYSLYAESVITKSNKGRPDNLRQIYHGINREDFFPVHQATSRTQLGLPQDAFIVGMVARNQYRKRFDLLAAGFAEFAKGKDDVKLYIHTALKDIGFDIPDLINQFGLEDKLILTEGITSAKGVTTERLNLIYNSLDVHALISMGDGFGLPVAESMATACPQLVSDHSCLKELVEGHGGLTVKTAAWILNTNSINTWGGVSDYKDIAKKLDVLYDSKPYRIRLAEEAYNFIIQEKFTWDFSANQFNQLFKEMLHIL